MRFTKMQGIGNDYVYINTLEETVTDPADLGRLLHADEDPARRKILILRRDAAESMLTGIPGDEGQNPLILLMTPEHRLEELSLEQPQ